MPYLLVLSTASSKREAVKLADLILSQKLAACINLSNVESHYRWKGKKEKSREVLMLIKTRTSAYPKLEALIKKHHSYELPEIIAVPIVKGSKAYLRWFNSQI